MTPSALIVRATLTGSGIAGVTSGAAGSVSAAHRMVALFAVVLRKTPSFGWAVPIVSWVSSGEIAAIRRSSNTSVQPAVPKPVSADGSNTRVPFGWTTAVRYFFEKNGKSKPRFSNNVLRDAESCISFGNGGSPVEGVVLVKIAYGCCVVAVASTTSAGPPPKIKP